MPVSKEELLGLIPNKATKAAEMRVKLDSTLRSAAIEGRGYVRLSRRAEKLMDDETVDELAELYRQAGYTVNVSTEALFIIWKESERIPTPRKR